MPEKTYLLKHDTGNLDTYWVQDAPRGLWIRFNTPVTPFKVNKIFIMGKRTDFSQPDTKNYTIKIWDGDFKQELYSKEYPYSKFNTYFDLVANEINPPTTVTGNFIIEFISNSETIWSPGQVPTGKTILIYADHTPDSPGNIGVSILGSNNIAAFQNMLQYSAGLKQGTWVIRAEGVGKAEGAVTTATLPPPAVLPSTAEKVTTFNAVKYTDPTYRFSVSYPKEWTVLPTTLRGDVLKGYVFHAKGPGNDNYVYVAVRPAINFRDAANAYMNDLITASGYQVSSSIDSETTITLADGTKADVILLSAAFGQAKAAITGVLKDGNAIMICGVMDPKNLELYKEIGSTLALQTTIPNSLTAQSGDNKAITVAPTATDQTAPAVPIVVTPTPLQGLPATLRYDYLNSEEKLFTQVAVWHSMASFSFPNWGIAGKFVESPLIILPGKEGAVAITGDGSGGYKYLPIGTISYRDTVDEKAELSKPGWGLATTFHPEKTPFAIRSINIAAVANYTRGILDDYNKKFVFINILNAKSEVIWSKQYKWSDFRSTAASGQLPQAVWKEIPVGVTVDSDFTVDILALSYAYNKAGYAYEYFAVAYERIEKCGDVTTNSFISGNGKRYNSYIRLYDQYGMPVCFNLCIRVDGSY